MDCPFSTMSWKYQLLPIKCQFKKDIPNETTPLHYNGNIAAWLEIMNNTRFNGKYFVSSCKVAITLYSLFGITAISLFSISVIRTQVAL